MDKNYKETMARILKEKANKEENEFKKQLYLNQVDKILSSCYY